MIDFRSLQVEHFSEEVETIHRRIYGDAEQELLTNTLNISRMALSKMSVSNSLFLNVNHTKRAGIIALQILNGFLHDRGDVEPPLFFNLILATLIAHVGIVGGILEEDEVKPNQNLVRYYIGKGKYKEYDGPSSNSVLWPDYINRSLLFIDRNFRSLKNLNLEDVKSAIRLSDISRSTSSKEFSTFCYYVRSAHMIAFMTQSQYNQWLVRLYRSLEEAELLDEIGFDDLGQFRGGYSSYFWDTFYTDLTHTIPLLSGTGAGKEVLATLYSRISNTK